MTPPRLPFRIAVCLALGVLALIAVSRPLPAEETSRRIDPAGISGSLVVSGQGVPDEALEWFVRLAQSRQSRLVVLLTDSAPANREIASRLLAEWESQRGASLDVVRLTAGDDAASQAAERLRSATGVWLASTDAASLRERTAAGSAVRQQLDALLQRGGVIGGAATAAAHFARLVDEPAVEPAIAERGLDLFPDALLEMQSSLQEGELRLDESLAAHRGTVGYEIDSDAALVVRGRRLRKVGGGSVRIHLPACETRPARQITLDSPRDAADLTALRLAAAARCAAPFPPAQPQPPVVEHGTLILIGGNGLPDGIVARFVELAGGAEAAIVVLPTALADPLPRKDRMAESFRRAGAKQVTVLPGRTLEEVESESYLKTLSEATGIWFGGGRQWRFADAYLDTKAHQLMHQVLARGGVIMGSSAGASIQAEYLARANPLGNRDIMAEGYERGLGFLPGAAVDQHFAQRNRFADMKSLIERYPQLLGIGIDEGTAILVQGGRAQVVGRGGTHFYDAAQGDHATVRDGGRYDLVRRQVIDPGGAKEDEQR